MYWFIIIFFCKKKKHIQLVRLSKELLIAAEKNRDHILANKLNLYLFGSDIMSGEWSESDIKLVPPHIWHPCLTVGFQIFCTGGRNDLCISCPMEAANIKLVISNCSYEHIKYLLLMRKLVNDGPATLIIANKIPTADTTKACT